MKNKLVVIIIIYLTVFIIGCNNDGKTNPEGDLSFEKEKITFKWGKRELEIGFNFRKINQPRVDRKWEKINLKSKFKLGGIDEDLFYSPSQVKTDRNENIYVLDNLDCSVKIFDKDGNYIKKFGRKGKGPGEFENAFDFDIIDDGKVVILSPNYNKFSVFDDNDIFEFKPTNMALSLCFYSSHEVIVFQIMDLINISPIRRINYKINEIKEYQNILNTKSIESENVGMLPFLIGDVHRYQANKIIYISYIMGYVLIYNDHGKIVNEFKLINESQDSYLTKREDKLKGEDNPLIRFPQSKEYLFLYSNVSGDNLFVLRNESEKKDDHFTVDVYSLTSCSYSYSLLLSGLGEVLSVYFSQKDLYVIKETTEVEVFEYQFN